MRRLAITAVVLVAFAGTLSTTAAQTTTGRTAFIPAPPPQCTAKAFRPFSAAVWDLDQWERGKPPRKTILAQRQRLRCAPSPSHRQAMRKTWGADKLRYGRYRALRLVAPYPGGGTWWAIPYYIVYCESGTSGLWAAANPSGAVGPYQLLGWGAPYPAYTWREKMANHRIAASVWAGGAGASNWACA